MKAQKLRDRVTIYKQIDAQRSPTGAMLPATWSPWIVLWANVEPLSVRDKIRAKAAGSQITARCTLRHRSDIKSHMQIEWQQRRYEIDGDPLPDATTGREYITLTLKEVTS